MIHQPQGGVQGTASDIKIRAEEMIKLKRWMNQLFKKHTGQPLERIEKDSDRDFYMDAQEAKTYGIVDEVVTSLKQIPQAGEHVGGGKEEL
jgi:ATP-dependent Clp protease protease subunit